MFTNTMWHWYLKDKKMLLYSYWNDYSDAKIALKAFETILFKFIDLRMLKLIINKTFLRQFNNFILKNGRI